MAFAISSAKSFCAMEARLLRAMYSPASASLLTEQSSGIAVGFGENEHRTIRLVGGRHEAGDESPATSLTSPASPMVRRERASPQRFQNHKIGQGSTTVLMQMRMRPAEFLANTRQTRGTPLWGRTQIAVAVKLRRGICCPQLKSAASVYQSNPDRHGGEPLTPARKSSSTKTSPANLGNGGARLSSWSAVCL